MNPTLAKKILSEYPAWIAEEKELKSQLAEVQEMKDNLQALHAIDPSRQRAQNPTPLESILIDLLTKEEEIQNQIQDVKSQQKRIIRFCSCIEDPETREMATKKYLEGLSWSLMEKRYYCKKATIDYRISKELSKIKGGHF